MNLKLIGSLTLMVALLLIVFVVYTCWVSGTHPNMVERGQFGDTYGTLNAFFAAMAFCGIAYGIVLQQRHHAEEMKLQKDQHDQLVESERTRHAEELLTQEQKRAREIRSERLRRDEDRFHRLLESWHAVALSTKVKAGQTEFAGIDAFLRLEHKLVAAVLEHRKDKRTPLDSIAIKGVFDNFYEQQAGAPLGHIFRMLEGLVHSVDSDPDLTRDEKQERLLPLRLLLSDPELHILLYAGFSGYVGSKFSRLIDQYGLLDGLTGKPLGHPSSEVKDGQLFTIKDRIAEIELYPLTWNKWKYRRGAISQ